MKWATATDWVGTRRGKCMLRVTVSRQLVNPRLRAALKVLSSGSRRCRLFCNKLLHPRDTIGRYTVWTNRTATSVGCTAAATSLAQIFSVLLFCCGACIIHQLSLLGRAVAQAVRRRPLTAEARVRSRGQSMWDLWWTNRHWERFYPEYLSFSWQFHSTGPSLYGKAEKTNRLHYRAEQ
jgi:hypothetical protein